MNTKLLKILISLLLPITLIANEDPITNSLITPHNPPVPAYQQKAESPSLIAHSPIRLQASITRYQSGDPDTKKVVDLILKTVDEYIIDAPSPSVITKPVTPPSGDIHDYMSMSPYWWPNPDTPDGLPYIRIDGKVNPLRYKGDNVTMDKMVESSWYCALAYAYTGQERYAAKAADILRTWFLNPETKMNPNLTYSQWRIGWDVLRPSALLDSQRFLRMIDAAPLILASDAWTHADQTALKSWFSEYTTWYHTSEQGIGQAKAPNNHGSYYDTQLISFAAFAGQTDLAKDVLKNYSQGRIAPQVAPDGNQPHELKRTRPFHYHNFNANAWIFAAQIGDNLGIDVWDPTANNALGHALKWLEPYATREKEWIKPTPIKERDLLVYRYLITQAADHYPQLDKAAILSKLPDFDYTSKKQLRYIIECELAK